MHSAAIYYREQTSSRAIGDLTLQQSNNLLEYMRTVEQIDLVEFGECPLLLVPRPLHNENGMPKVDKLALGEEHPFS